MPDSDPEPPRRPSCAVGGHLDNAGNLALISTETIHLANANDTRNGTGTTNGNRIFDTTGVTGAALPMRS